MGQCQLRPNPFRQVGREGNYRCVQGPSGTMVKQTVAFLASEEQLQALKSRLQQRQRLNAQVPRMRAELIGGGCCGSMLKVKLQTEKAVLRLADLPYLELDEAVVVLTNLLQINDELERNYDYQFSQKKAGLNARGAVMLWINDDYFSCTPAAYTCNRERSNQQLIFGALVSKCTAAQFVAWTERLSPPVKGSRSKLDITKLLKRRESARPALRSHQI